MHAWSVQNDLWEQTDMPHEAIARELDRQIRVPKGLCSFLLEKCFRRFSLGSINQQFLESYP